MRIIKLFGLHANGEPKVWWNWQNLNRDKEDRVKGWPKHGRAWLFWYPDRSHDNNLGLEWVLFSNRCGIDLEFCTMGDENIILSLRIPFLITFYFSIGRARWVERLPGVKWHERSTRKGKKDHSPGHRELSISIHDWAIWWRIWRNPMEGYSNDWRDRCFHIDNFFLGQLDVSREPNGQNNTYLEMPEGFYPCHIDFSTMIRKRRRWPVAKHIPMASIEIEGGVPVPGDSDSDFFDGDDATYAITLKANNTVEALENLRQHVFATRDRYAEPHWQPDAGWPAHCLRTLPQDDD